MTPILAHCEPRHKSLPRCCEWSVPTCRSYTVLVNYYPDGSSKINFHSDDEDDIEDNSFIFTLSFGHSRTIIFRTLERKKHVAKISLKDRSILLFSKASQHLFQHAIQHETGVSERISLTFRKLKDKSVYRPDIAPHPWVVYKNILYSHLFENQMKE